MVAYFKRGSKVTKNSRKGGQRNHSWSIATVCFVFLILIISPIPSWGFSSKIHSEITQDALRFLRDDILISMIAGNIHQDD